QKLKGDDRRNDQSGGEFRLTPHNADARSSEHEGQYLCPDGCELLREELPASPLCAAQLLVHGIGKQYTEQVNEKERNEAQRHIGRDSRKRRKSALKDPFFQGLA